MKFFSDNVSVLRNYAFGIFTVFLLTLTNSIFLNQLGYYGALLLLIYSYFARKEKAFSPTGLEIPFLFYTAVLILSTIFSVNQGQSFHNLLKRILLIPIVYTTVAVLTDNKKIKSAIFIFLFAAIAVVVVYLAHSYEYFIQNLYQVKESGPSLFQYPITASELMSIVLIFCFTLIFDKELSVKWRAASVIGFLLSTAALLATYKRTGWLAAAAGLIIVLLLKKQWKLLTAGALLLLVIFFTDKSYSEIWTFKNFSGSGNAPVVEQTAGRANAVISSGNKQYIAGYEAGLTVREGSRVRNFDAGSAVLDVEPITDSTVLLYLVDTRFVLFNIGEEKGKVENVFTTPGLVYSYSLSNNNLFVLDGDGYLTKFTINGNKIDSVHYPTIKGYQQVFADGSNIILSSRTGVNVYSMNEDGSISRSAGYPELNGSVVLGIYNDHYILSRGGETSVYKIGEGSLSIAGELPSVANATRMDTIEGNAYLWNSTGDLWEVKPDSSGSLTIILKHSYNTLIKDIDVRGGDLYLARYKRSRLSSFYDPYNMSNQSRIAFWTAGFKMFADRPLLGAGDIDLRDLYVKYKRPFDKEIQGHMHNNYVHILVTLGAVGFIAFMFLIIKIIIVLFGNVNRTKTDGFNNSLAVAALASFIAFLTAGLTEWNFGDHEIISMIWFVVGLSITAARREEKITAP